MKTGEKIIDQDVTTNNNDITSINSDTEANKDITVIIKRGGKSATPIILSLLPVMSALAAILTGVISRADGVEIARLGIITLLLTGAAVFYIRLNPESILRNKLSKTIIILGYLSSLFLLLLVPQPEVLSFWMLGCLLVSMLIDNKLGLLMHFNMAFIMGISLTVSPETVIQVLIIGVLMSILAGALRQKASVIYAAIIILSANITVSFAIHNFAFEKENNYSYLNSLFSIFAVLAVAYFLCLLYDNGVVDAFGSASEPDDESQTTAEDALKIQASDLASTEAATALELSSDKPLSAQEITAGKDISDAHVIGTRTSYEVLCDPENALLVKLKAHSEDLYQHALRIGDLSCRAAKEIGADMMLAQAGGYYHEIGKINGKNYIEEGLLIAEDYAFPKELKAIIKEHNIKYDKPSCVEAAIVMLSDSVESTVDYIKKNDEHKFTTEKIIDNIFQMRMDKGTFNNANLSLKDYKILKDFFQKEYKETI